MRAPPTCPTHTHTHTHTHTILALATVDMKGRTHRSRARLESEQVPSAGPETTLPPSIRGVPSKVEVGYESGEGNGTPLQYSCLENPMDGGAWWTAVHGVARSWTRLYNFQIDKLSDFTFTFHFHALEKEMASHSSVLAWRIPGTGEPGGLPSLGSHRVGHN